MASFVIVDKLGESHTILVDDADYERVMAAGKWKIYKRTSHTTRVVRLVDRTNRETLYKFITSVEPWAASLKDTANWRDNRRSNIVVEVERSGHYIKHDYTGKQFCGWTAIKPVSKRSWLVQCSCGYTRTCTRKFVVAGKLSRCSKCGPGEYAVSRCDRAGRRYGPWTVFEYVGMTKSRGASRWKCRCDCGAENVLSAQGLRCAERRGATRCNRCRAGVKPAMATKRQATGVVALPPPKPVKRLPPQTAMQRARVMELIAKKYG
jgi:hypothetical protein